MFELFPIPQSETKSSYAEAAMKLVFDNFYIIFNTAAFAVALYGSLVPLFFGMIIASTKQQRQSPIFRFLVLAFILGTLLFILIMIMCGLLIKGENPISSDSLLASIIGSQLLAYLCCLTLDLCLAAKMKSYFPSSLYSRKYSFLILSPLLILSIARLIDACVMIAWYSKEKATMNMKIFIAYAVEQVRTLQSNSIQCVYNDLPFASSPLHSACMLYRISIVQ